MWIIIYAIILSLYFIMAVVQLARSKPSPIILAVQVFIIGGCWPFLIEYV